MSKRITPAMVAEGLGVPVQAIRVGLQQGKLDFGVAIQQTAKKYTYIIYPEKVKQVVPEEIYQTWGL